MQVLFQVPTTPEHFISISYSASTRLVILRMIRFRVSSKLGVGGERLLGRRNCFDDAMP